MHRTRLTHALFACSGALALVALSSAPTSAQAANPVPPPAAPAPAVPTVQPAPPASAPPAAAAQPAAAQPVLSPAAVPDVRYAEEDAQGFVVKAPERERPSWALAYEVGFPVADLHKFTENVSPRGMGFNFEWPVIAGLRLGAAFHYSRFYDERDRTTYEFEGGAINAKLYRYLDVWSFAASGRYRFGSPSDPVRGFVGLEVGVAFVNATTLLADTGVQDTPTGLLVGGEIGIAARITKGYLATIALRYNLTTASFGQTDIPSYLALQLGFAWEGAN
jgi:hypothetical protein